MTNDAGGPGSELRDPDRPREEQGQEHEGVEVRRLTAALEDIVALALSAGDARQRTILMHRRAVAALSGADREPRPQEGG